MSNSIFDFPAQAREHNERMAKERLKQPADTGSKFVPDFPDGEQIAPGVYQQGGMIIVGDKY